MGTIRNRMVIVHDYHKDKLMKIREDAVKTFQMAVGESVNVDKDLISPIMNGFVNREYTFVINGECSKLGWSESDIMQDIRIKWCEKWKKEVSNMILIDFGEDFSTKIFEFNREEEDLSIDIFTRKDD